MKELKKIKLNQLSKDDLEKETMKVLKGGRCDCGDVNCKTGGEELAEELEAIEDGY